jgi:hypothetical protein
MPQNPFFAKPPLGVVYITSMSRPDAALALAELFGFEGKRESRMGSICVTGAGLAAAMYCDIVTGFYHPGPARNANSVLPVGLGAVDPMPADAPMVRPVVERTEYARTIRKLSDTSLAEAVIRNGVIFNAEAVVILSAPATYLARSLDLQGVPGLYKERVKRLVVVETGASAEDPTALRKALAEWPTPIFFCGREVGDALTFPGASIEKDFAWTPNHPVAEAYRAFRPMPYDAPSFDVAAAHFAVHPDSGFWKLSDPGEISVGADGGMKFALQSGGRARALAIDPAQRDKIMEAFTTMASAKPVAPQQRFRPPSNTATPTPPVKK